MPPELQRPRKQDLTRTGPFQWEIPAAFRSDMRVPVRLFANESLLDDALDDASLLQAVNAATLPGLVGHVTVMPDVHQGYGFPIGGVAASRLSDGVVSPGAIGYDINCGVRLLASRLRLDETETRLGELATALVRPLPERGRGEGDRPPDGQRPGARLSRRLPSGRNATASRRQATWRRPKKAGAWREPIRATSASGRSNAGGRSSEPWAPGITSLKSIWWRKSSIRRPPRAMGLAVGALAVQIHCGSRGFGHQVCSDYVRELQTAVRRYGIRLPDRELVCAPLDSPEGRGYLSAMACAANYAFANRQILAHHVRRAFEQVFGEGANSRLTQVYDIAHNMGKIEDHQVAGHKSAVCVHRKGATRAFGPGFEGLPRGLPSFRPAGAGPGQHGNRVVGSTGYRRFDAAGVRFNLPRRGPADEPQAGQAVGPGRPSAGGTRGQGYPNSRRQPAGPGRGSPVCLQGRRRSGEGRDRGRHRQEGGPAATAGCGQGVTPGSVTPPKGRSCRSDEGSTRGLPTNPSLVPLA